LTANDTDNLLKKPIKTLLKAKTVQQIPKNGQAFSVRVNPIVVSRARHMFLRVRITYHVYDMLCKSQTQPGSGEGCSGSATGYPVTVLGEEAAPLRRGTANAWGDVQKSSEAGLVGRVRNTG